MTNPTEHADLGGAAPQEWEWTDQFGTHFEARQVGADGRIYSQVVTRPANFWGWGALIENARLNVRRAVLAKVTAR